MTERCLDVFPEDWVNPHIERFNDFDKKYYADGVSVIFMSPTHSVWLDGEIYQVTPECIETRFPDRGLHFERGYKSEVSLYIPDGIPKDAEI